MTRQLELLPENVDPRRSRVRGGERYRPPDLQWSLRQKEHVESAAADVTEHLDAGVASLRAQEAYLRGLGRNFDPEEFVRAMTGMAGPTIGVRHAVAFGCIQLEGV